ncbi:cyclase family protein [Stygiolobus sp. RP850M]|jgi:kynurenine formamidase|uniref:cyclase family protein n=1 Tax=Stygiolobus sp. RP850M TaxID=3133137 RepID=UPI00307D8CDF
MIIDLSVPIENEMPFYPGDPQPRLREIKIKDYMVHELLIGTHTGTHVDVPYHFIPEGKRLDQIPLERFMGKAYVTDSVDHAVVSSFR